MKNPITENRQGFSRLVIPLFFLMLNYTAIGQWLTAKKATTDLVALKTSNPVKYMNEWQQPVQKQPDATNLLNNTSLLFTENLGQVANDKGRSMPNILFTAHSGGSKIYLDTKGIQYQFTKTEYPKGYEPDAKKIRDIKLQASLEKKVKTITQRLGVSLVGADPKMVVRREERSDYTENFFLAQCPNGITAHTYGRVVYENVYPGIDWIIYGNGQGLEYDFVIKPGADVGQIKLKVDGAKIMMGTDEGLVMKTPLGEVLEKAPVASCGSKKVASRFVRTGNTTFGFQVENYDKQQVLTIDPSVVWATYYGGSDIHNLGDQGNSCSVDASGNVFLAGSTGSSSSIASPGAQQGALGAGLNEDAFLVKFNSAGVRQWGTYYGGTNNDLGLSCAADGNGNVFLVGQTGSTGLSTNGTLVTGNGNFLAMFNGAGIRQWATYYDLGFWCAADGSGNVYLTGSVSTGTFDAAVAKFNNNGTLQWRINYGGTGTENVYGCATDGNNVYITGSTTSTAGIATAEAYQTVYAGGSSDAYLAKFSSTGILLWATYYGGENTDIGESCTVDGSGNVYLAGQTLSSSGIASASAQQTFYSGNRDAFLVKFNSSGARQWGTYLGGAGSDAGFACAVDGNGFVYLAGTTSSNTLYFNGLTNHFTGGGFLAKYDNTGNLQWNTYYGGAGDQIRNVAIADNCIIYVAGTTSLTTGVATAGAHQTIYGGDPSDAFLVKITTASNTAPALAGNGLATSTTMVACADTTGYLQFVDATTPANKYLAIHPNGNTGYDFATNPPVTSNNSPTVANQMRTDGTQNTTALANRMYTVRDNGTNNYPSGMTVRLYYAAADTTAAVAALDNAHVSSPFTSRWFKFEGTTHTANVAAILAAQTSSGITGATYLTPSAKGTESGVNYVEFNNITSFSTFGYLASKSVVVLPVTLTSFTASANGCAAILDWKTSNESNSNHYDVEAGTDGTTFTKVGTVASKNSVTGAAYSYLYDRTSVGTNYFRLKMEDNDGRDTYSQTVVLTGNGACGTNIPVRVFSNPTKEIMNIQGLAIGSHLQLFDINGKKLTEIIVGTSNTTVNISSYAAGVYNLRINAVNGTVRMVKVVKE